MAQSVATTRRFTRVLGNRLQFTRIVETSCWTRRRAPSPAWKYASSMETACRVMVRALTRRTQPGDGTMNVVETITDKQRAIDALRALPDHATLEDAIE